MLIKCRYYITCYKSIVSIVLADASFCNISNKIVVECRYSYIDTQTTYIHTHNMYMHYFVLMQLTANPNAIILCSALISECKKNISYKINTRMLFGFYGADILMGKSGILIRKE